MATKFDNYGGKVDFLEHTEKKFTGPNDKQGGDVDPFGDVEKKGKSDMDMNAAAAFAKKDFTKVEAMGTDYPCKGGKPGQFSDNKGDHFKVGEVDPSGNDEAKSSSGQSRH